jgi:hypothetical protein
MMTAHEQQDEYEAGASLYVDLKSSYYELLYQEWTFAQSDEEEIENENDDELEEDEDAFSDDEEDIKQPIEYVSKPIQVRSKNVFVHCAIRDKVIKNFDEIVQNTELATQIEESMLHVVSDHAVKENMEVDWSNLRNWGAESERSDAKNCFYPVIVQDGEIIGFGNVEEDSVHPKQNTVKGKQTYVYPIDIKGIERKSTEAIKNIDRILSPENEKGLAQQFGGFGAYVTQYGAGETADVANLIAQFKSSLKSAGLEEFRTGGSIGAMTVAEWPIVEAEIASLNPKMTLEAAKATMRRVQTRLQNMSDDARATYNDTWQRTQFHKPRVSGQDKPPIDTFDRK